MGEWGNKNILNVANQRNANQKHNEISSHTWSEELSLKGKSKKGNLVRM